MKDLSENAAKPADKSGDGAGVETSERYHHGRLREALIEAAHALVREKGVDGFRVAEASRAAGVSSAAPYRHFRDREELLAEVARKGFEALATEARAARAGHAPGSVEALIAIGRAYVRFVSSDPQMYHLMWGGGRAEVAGDIPPVCAPGFDVLLETVDAVRAAQGLEHVPTMEFALVVWSGVHGLASLKLFDQLEMMAEVDLEASIESATRAYIAGLQATRDRANA